MVATLTKFMPNKKQLLALSAVLLVGALLVPTANAGTVIIDVRTPEEYQLNHPAGAINIPHHEIVAKIASQGVSKSDTIKLYSGKSSRAEQAKTALQSVGYTNVEVQK